MEASDEANETKKFFDINHKGFFRFCFCLNTFFTESDPDLEYTKRLVHYILQRYVAPRSKELFELAFSTYESHGRCLLFAGVKDEEARQKIERGVCYFPISILLVILAGTSHCFAIPG